MSNPYILELKEAYDNSKVSQAQQDEHGIYSTTFANSIPITEGTQIAIKQVFIDSVAKESEKIQLDEDLEVSMSLCKYFTNNTTQTSQNFNYYPTAGSPASDFPDGLDYFECDFAGSNTNYFEVTSMYIKASGTNIFRGMGGVVARVQYTTPNNQVAIGSFEIPDRRPRDFSTKGVPKELGSGDFHLYHNICKFETLDGQLILLNPEDLEKVHISYGDNNVGSVIWNDNPTQKTDRGNELTLHSDKYTFTIPKNVKGYDPAELARFITDQITDVSEGQNKVTNKYFTTSPLQNAKSETAFLKQVSGATQIVGGNPKKKYFITTNGQRIAEQKATPTNDTYYGASEIALEWGGDEGINDFKFTALHTPLYDVTNGSKTFISQVFQAGTSGNFFIAGRSGGVILTDLEPADFWFNKLNFNQSLVVNPNSKNNPAGYFGNDVNGDNILAGANGSQVPDLETVTGNFKGLFDGTNMTSNFRGLDSLITGADGMVVPTLTNIKSTTSTTNAIIGNNPFTETIATDGYFIVEVDLGIGSTEWTSVNNLTYGQKVKGIVSRYYATDTYTSANTESSIPFIYKGLPTKIQQARVRILDSQGNPISENIGNDNSVFLEIIPPPQN